MHHRLRDPLGRACRLRTKSPVLVVVILSIPLLGCGNTMETSVSEDALSMASNTPPYTTTPYEAVSR